MKRILCMLLVSVLVLGCFIGCGEQATLENNTDIISDTEKNPEDTADNGDNGDGSISVSAQALGTLFSQMIGVSEDSVVSGGSQMSVSVADPTALMTLLGENGAENPDIKNIYFDMIYDFANGKAVSSLGAKLFGEEHKVSLYEDLEGIVLSAPSLYNKSYGISYEELVSLFTDSMADELGSGYTELIELLSDPEKLTALLSRYVEKLDTALKANVSFAVSEEGNTKNISFTLTPDNTAVILTELIEAFCADDEALEIMTALSGVTKDQFLSGKPSKAQLISSAKEILNNSGFGAEIKLTLDKTDSSVLSADITASIGDALAVFTFNSGDGNLSLSIKDKQGSGELIFKIDNRDENTVILFEFTERSSYIDDNGAEAAYTDVSKIEAVIGQSSACISVESKDGLLGSEEKQEFKLEWAENTAVLTVTNNSQDGELDAYSVKVEIKLTRNDNSIDLNMAQSIKYGTEVYETLSTGKLEWTDTYISLTFNDGEDKTTLKGELKDSKLVLSMDIDDGEDKMSGEIVFDAAMTENSAEFTLSSFKTSGIEMDLSSIGLKIAFKTGVAVPETPEYESVAGLDENALKDIIEDFAQKNKTLISKLADAGLLGSSNEDVSSSAAVQHT